MKLTRYITLFAFTVMVLFAVSGQVWAQSSIQVKEQRMQEDQFKVKYQQFTGIENQMAQRKINMDVKVAVDRFIADRKKDKRNIESVVSYKVYYTDKDKLSFEVLLYEYNGGAHGMSYVSGFVYDVKTGDRLSLTRLFDYRPSEINRTIFSHAKEHEIYLFDEFAGIKEYPQNFYLNEQGKAVLLFQQYEIAPYSSGIIRVEMN